MFTKPTNIPLAQRYKHRNTDQENGVLAALILAVNMNFPDTYCDPET